MGVLLIEGQSQAVPGDELRVKMITLAVEWGIDLREPRKGRCLP